MAAPTDDRKPAVVVDDVHVEYKVLATGKRSDLSAGQECQNRPDDVLVDGLRVNHAVADREQY